MHHASITPSIFSSHRIEFPSFHRQVEASIENSVNPERVFYQVVQRLLAGKFSMVNGHISADILNLFFHWKGLLDFHWRKCWSTSCRVKAFESSKAVSAHLSYIAVRWMIVNQGRRMSWARDFGLPCVCSMSLCREEGGVRLRTCTCMCTILRCIFSDIFFSGKMVS